MDKSIRNVVEDKCVGCMVCRSVCPVKAISICRDCEGFDFPEIDDEICMNCGRCLEICPAEHEISEDFLYDEVYAMQTNEEIRKISSSGGIFTLLANEIIGEGGFVCGAAFEGIKVKHIIINQLNDIEKLRRSKYVQSDMSECYDKILVLLKKGKKVLFTGTSCQCEAIKNFCKGFDDLLYVVDILCMGVPSPGLFERYICEEITKGELNDINFRDKSEEGWTPNFFFSYKKDNIKYILNNKDSSYYTSFLEGWALRKSCYNCKYSGKKRISDLTIGDFWGIKEIDEELDDGIGTSQVLVSTKKGDELLEKIKKHCQKIKEIEISTAATACFRLLYPIADRGLRKEFFEEVSRNSMAKAVKKLKNNEACCGIINYWWADENGEILTAYALQQSLLKLGHTSRLIDLKKDNIPGGISEKFAKKYLYVTMRIISENDYYNLNDSFDNFLVGPGQVFRTENSSDHCFLDFVDDKKNKVAVSVSLWENILDIPSKKRKIKIKYLLSRFNSISTRERKGVKLSKRFGIKAIDIIDPVFYLSSQEYIEKLGLTKYSAGKEFVFIYFKDVSEEKMDCAKKIAEKYGYEMFFADDTTEVEEILQKMYNSQFVITDYYYGLCLSIIFNKKYICLLSNKSEMDQFLSVAHIFSLDLKRFVSVTEVNLDEDILSKNENWEKVNETVKTKSSESLLWLAHVIETKQKINKFRLKVRKFHLGNCESFEKCRKYLKRKGISYQMRCSKKRLQDKIVCFGAGKYGMMALDEFNKDEIAFFIDNSKDKRWLGEYPIFTLKEASKIIKKSNKIVITTSAAYQNDIMTQLLSLGYTNLELYDNSLKERRKGYNGYSH